MTLRKALVGGAVALTALAGSAVLAPTPASAYPVDKLVGVAIVGDVAYLVYETPAGGFYLVEI